MTPSQTKTTAGSTAQVEVQASTITFSIRRILRLSTFHIGSAMGDILTTNVWNRIMISDFGIPAWPVGLLLALKYFLAPISLWVGYRSDTKPLLGWYRTSYIWLGRFSMLLSFPLLGAGTVILERNTADPFGWFVSSLSFILYGLGTLLSGSPFLALVRDSKKKKKQGIAISIVQTAMITMFPIVAFTFSRMLVSYRSDLFWRLILFVSVIGGFFWFVAIAGAEKRNRRWYSAEAGKKRIGSESIDLRNTFRIIWNDGRTRRFFVFLFVATFAAWMQDNILEPFGAEVFGFQVAETTRFTSYWGSATVLVLFSSFFIWRKRKPEEQSAVTKVGLVIMALGMILLTGSAFNAQETLLIPSLIVFGAGFGLYTFGGLSLMAAMSPDPNSGAYLGLWTVAILVSRGMGTFMGGVFRDVLFAMQVNETGTYAIIFGIAALGLVSAVAVLTGIDFFAFVRDNEESIQEG